MTKLSLTALALFAALGSGCAENQETLLVLNAPAWPSDGCVISASASGESLPFGILDLAYGTPYDMPAVLKNNAAKQAVNDNNSGVETNELQITDADVDLSLAQAPEVIDALEAIDEHFVSFNVPLSTNSISPGALQGVLVEVIPQRTAVELGKAILAKFGANARLTLVADVQFHASRSGNSIGKVGQIDARDFSFPISLCIGCLTDCSTCMDAMCPTMDSGDWVGGVCGNAQDLPVFPAVCGSSD